MSGEDVLCVVAESVIADQKQAVSALQNQMAALQAAVQAQTGQNETLQQDNRRLREQNTELHARVQRFEAEHDQLAQAKAKWDAERRALQLAVQQSQQPAPVVHQQPEPCCLVKLYNKITA